MLSLICIVFCLLPFYWSYLVFSTQPMVIFDAVEYERMGRLLLDQGWSAYFAGLHREPLFPLLLSWAMGLERSYAVPYAVYIKCFLLIFLAISMWGTYRLTRLLGAGRIASSLAALYVGISPDLLNSTLWLWSEAAAYPWVVWLVFVSISLWRMVNAVRPWAGIVACSVVLAVLFFFLTMVKAIAATILMLYFIPFYGAVLVFVFQRQWAKCARGVVAVVIVLGLAGGAVHSYKYLNWQRNGQYELTNRGDIALFGNTVRRLQPMTRERVAQAFLSVPRLGLCERVYGNKECLFWTYVPSDLIFQQARKDLVAQGLSLAEQSKFFVDHSLRLMTEHPWQEGFFMLVEASKMFFWENRLYFVKYPPWLARIYSNFTVIYVLCFVWAIFSLLGFCYAVGYLARGLVRGKAAVADKRYAAWLLVFWFIVCFSGLYSLFFIDMRYALPIAPLFVALFFGWGSRCYARIRYNVR